MNRESKKNITDRHDVHNVAVSMTIKLSDDETGTPGRIGDRGADEESSSHNPSDYFLVGCSDYPATSEISGIPSAMIIFHDNIANLVAATDINCLSAMQLAVEICRVKNIVVCGHYGCRGITAAIETRQFNVLSNWLRPVVRLADKYKIPLESITDRSDRLDALCELNVIEQVVSACRTTVVQEAWENGQELSVGGLVYNRQNVLLADFHISIRGNDSLSMEHTAAIVAFKRRWNLRLEG